MGGSFGEEMTFFQRAYNLFNTLVYIQYNYGPIAAYQKMFESNYPGFPDIKVCVFPWTIIHGDSKFAVNGKSVRN